MQKNHRDGSRNREYSRQAFTLIELLVVIAIIAILAAILFPVFARARENARRASCQSNLKQLALGIIQYQQDYDETMPLAGRPAPTDAWYWGQNIMPYVKSTQVFECPSFKNTYIGDQNTYGVKATDPPMGQGYQSGWATSYGMNVMLLPVANTGFKVSRFTHASEVVMLTDSSRKFIAGQSLGQNPNPAAGTGDDNGQSGWYSVIYKGDAGDASGATSGGATAYSGGFAACGPDARHLGTTNVAFADGHVKAMKFDTIYKIPASVTAPNWTLWFPEAP